MSTTAISGRARGSLLEVLAAVRAAVGRDFFVSMKLSGRDAHNASAGLLNRTVGNTIDDTMKVSRWLADAGLDAIHLSQGDSFPHPLIPAGLLPADDAKRALAGMFYEGQTRADVAAAAAVLAVSPFHRVELGQAHALQARAASCARKDRGDEPG